jgi:hypothetical protein
MGSLPKAVSKDPCFAALRDAALSWHEQSHSVFRIQHRKSFEGGAFGCPSDIVNTLIYALRHCSGCGFTYTEDVINVLDVCVRYVQHLGYLPESLQRDYVDCWLTSLRSDKVIKERVRTPCLSMTFTVVPWAGSFYSIQDS